MAHEKFDISKLLFSALGGLVSMFGALGIGQVQANERAHAKYEAQIEAIQVRATEAAIQVGDLKPEFALLLAHTSRLAEEHGSIQSGLGSITDRVTRLEKHEDEPKSRR